jgi:hypothetical protein
VTSGTGDKKSIKFGQGNFLQDGTVTTIEGNTSGDKKKSASERNGGEVVQKTRAYRTDNKKKLPVFIVGFGSPKFKD